MNKDSKPIQSDSGQAVVVDLGTAGSGVLFDLSTAGMILRNVSLLVPGLFVTATFELPGTGAVIAASYEVMWTKDDNASLKLFSISDQDRRQIETWLRRKAMTSKADFVPIAAESVDAREESVRVEYPPSVQLPWFARVETPEPEPKGKSGWLMVALCVALVGAGIWAVTSAYLSWRGPGREAVSAPEVLPSTSEPVPPPAVSATAPAAAEPAAAVETPPAASRASAAPVDSRPADKSTPPSSKVPAAKVTATKSSAKVLPPAVAPAEVSQTSKPSEDASAPVSIPAANTPVAPPVTEPPAPRPAEVVAPAAAPPPVAPDQPLRVSADVMQQYAVKSPQPAYPAFARRARIEGPVVLGVLVGADGGVKRIRVIGGPPELAAGAVDAVRQWRFRPYLQDGKPVEVQTELRFQFQAPNN